MDRDKDTSIKDLQNEVQNFINERDWGKYHDPKNVSESIMIETAELMEEFQWMDVEKAENKIKDEDKLNSVKKELADVIIYCLSLSNQLEIDLSTAIKEKIEENKEKYPEEEFQGEWYKPE